MKVDLNLVKKLKAIWDKVIAETTCSICGSSYCDRKNQGPWHPAPPPGGWNNVPRNPPDEDMSDIIHKFGVPDSILGHDEVKE